MPDPDYMTTDEVATLARTAPGTVRYWRHIKFGPKGFRLGKRVLYRRDEVERWLAEREADQKSA